MTLTTVLVDQLRRELHDTGDEPERRYSDAKLVDYLNLAIKDILYRAPEANVVRELHTVAADDPPLQELVSDRAVKLIKVEANQDSRVGNVQPAPPSAPVGYTYILPDAYSGAPRWYEDYTILSFNPNVADLPRGVESAIPGLFYPDITTPGLFYSQEPAPNLDKPLPYYWTVWVTFEARLANPVTSDVSIQSSFQLSNNENEFTHTETPNPEIYWSESDDAPVNNGSPSVHAAREIACGENLDAAWLYSGGMTLNDEWSYCAALAYGGHMEGGGNIVIREEVSSLAFPAGLQPTQQRMRLIFAPSGAGFTEGPNQIEVRNVRLWFPEHELYDLGGAGLNRKFTWPHVRGDDGGPAAQNHFHPDIYNTFGGGYRPCFAGYDPNKLFPVGWGGSSQYTGRGLGQQIQQYLAFRGYIGPSVSDQYDFDRSGTLGCPAGQWEGNRIYYPSEEGIDLGEMGWDGAIDDLSIAVGHWMQQDSEPGVLNMKFSPRLEMSADRVTWNTVQSWSTVSDDRDNSFNPDTDSAYFSANTHPTYRYLRYMANTWMGFPAQADNTPANDILIHMSIQSIDFASRWGPVSPLDPGAEDQTRPIRWAEKDVFDTYDADWWFNPPAVSGDQDIQLLSWYTHYSHDPRDPTRFYLYPAPPSEQTAVYVHYAKVPDEIGDITSVFPMREQWEGAAVMYAKWLALSEQKRSSYLPEVSRTRLLNEYTTVVEAARQALYSDVLRDDG